MVSFLPVILVAQVDGDLRTTMKFIDSLKIPYNAPSFGGCESIIDQPALMSYWYYSLKFCFELQLSKLHSKVAKYDYHGIPDMIVSSNRDSPSERTKYGIKDNLVRFSCGVEDFEDLKADIAQALDAI